MRKSFLKEMKKLNTLLEMPGPKGGMGRMVHDGDSDDSSDDGSPSDVHHPVYGDRGFERFIRKDHNETKERLNDLHQDGKFDHMSADDHKDLADDHRIVMMGGSHGHRNGGVGKRTPLSRHQHIAHSAAADFHEKMANDKQSWWDSLSDEQKASYKRLHPGTRYK